ncbi:MAG TPA: S53 family peptidase [Streptosporangiaceae bacterium]|jgi:kumamolisin|nr:S53 family peptidase [Streptosporangiaceae bacterium]
MTAESFVPLAGSERTAISGVQDLGPVDEQERIEVTMVLRRRAELPDELVFSPEVISPAELADTYGADPADVELVRQTLSGFGLEITETDEASRRMKVAGTAATLGQAFGASLRQARSSHPGGSGEADHRYREGALQVPAALDGIVTAILGLDNRPQVRAHFRAADAAAAKTTSYTPPQVAQAYQFPASTDGTGQTIAILEFGGGFSTSDLQTYFSGLGLSVPSVTAASVDGGSNAPGSDPTGADGEVLLDIEVAGSVANQAAQVVYFGPNTDQAFIDSISDATHASPTPTVISISWGGPEETWTAQTRTAMDQALSDAAALGITVTVAAGDNGSSDGETDGSNHCDYPASSPYALGCGGTRLEASTSTGAISSETVWNDGSGGGATGGGISTLYPVPSWQASAGVPAASVSTGGRGVPDVAGNADPQTGYQVLVDGKQNVYGGTSAVAPLWAALIARLAQSTGKSFGLIQTQLYAGVTAGQDVAGFNDITTGSNGAYSAGPGWDPCTGLGSPSGTDLLNRLNG